LPGAQLARAAPRWSLSSFYAAEEVTTSILRELPARSVLLSSYFKSIFLWWHARAVEGERPDVVLVHRNFLRYPGYAEREAARHPELAELWRAYAATARFPAGELLRLTHRRPVRLEFDFNLQPDLTRDLVPRGWLWVLGTVVGEEAVVGQRNWFWREVQARLGSDLEEPETRRYVLWAQFLHAVAARERGWKLLSREEARRGLELSPESPELRALVEGQ
jgi:hypothetical protein